MPFNGPLKQVSPDTFETALEPLPELLLVHGLYLNLISHHTTHN